MSVFVLDQRHQPLMPCSEKRARLLLQRGRAVVHRHTPFVIRLTDRRLEASALQPVALKLDPGSQTTGITLVRVEEIPQGQKHHALHLAELAHRGDAIRSRVGNVLTWARRYRRWVPLTRIEVERGKFDTQALQQPEIAGLAYQRGTLFGWEVRAYVLAKFGYQCAYCGKQNVPFELDHIWPRSRGGSERVSNLALSCHECNQIKGDKTATEFGYPDVQKQAKVPLKDTAAVNSTRFRLVEELRALGLPVHCWTGGRTSWNRERFGIEKAHCLDALCMGDLAAVSGGNLPVLHIGATGRGSHCRTNVDDSGFPRGYLTRQKRIQGFSTGDLVRAVPPAHLKTAGVHVGRVAVRASGSFRVGKVDEINAKYCQLLQRADGYDYA